MLNFLKNHPKRLRGELYCAWLRYEKELQRTNNPGINIRLWGAQGRRASRFADDAMILFWSTIGLIVLLVLI